MSESKGWSYLIEDMSAEEANEFLDTQLNAQTKQAFLAKKKENKLQQAYEAEMEAIPASMPRYAKLQKITSIKAKFRSKGLQVY